MTTSNPVVFQILRDKLFMPEDEARSQLENNTLDLRDYDDFVHDYMVIAIAENCVGLTSIYLNDCDITDAAVISLAKNCPELKTINLCFCESITDAGVIALAEGCPGLTKINLDCCFNITDAAVIALAEGCAGLTWINLERYEDCENITDAAVIALAENCEYLEHIDFDVDPGDEPSKVSATGYQLIEEIETRPKPPPLEEGWWMDDGPGPQCKGMMN